MLAFVGVLVVLSILSQTVRGPWGCLLVLGTLAVGLYFLGDHVVDAVSVDRAASNANPSADKPTPPEAHPRHSAKVSEKKTEPRR